MRLGHYALLASAAALAPVAASAADLPSRKAAPVEYVRVCSTAGEGFFYIPGTDTCIQIGGRVRAEYRYTEPKGSIPGLGRAADAVGFRALARLNIDTRTPTAYGTLRTYIRFEFAGNRGVYGGGPNSGATDAYLDKAFIQWAGITAGRVQSFFDFYANDWNYGGLTTGSDSGNSNVLAYTATFGSGFSATIALEDMDARTVTGTGYVAAGSRLPDVVANLFYEGTWGTAQLSGALHELRSLNRDLVGAYLDNEYGFAIQAGVKVNLPMLAAGDVLWLQAAYVDGAVSYLGLGGDTTLGRVTAQIADAVATGNDLKTTEGWGFTAALTHYWTPNVRSSILGNYTEIDYDRAVTALGTGFVDSRIYTGIFQTVWTPVSGFDIGGEISYARIDPKGPGVFVPVPGYRIPSADDVWEARLRLQRDF